MLVREIMHAPVVSVAETTTLAEAYRLMEERHFRHLPVLHDGLLAGLVTDRDLRLATSGLSAHPHPSHARVSEVMTRHVITAGALDAVEDAARVMYDLKIGCLPVMEGSLMVGIVTGPDLLNALIRLTGVTRPSTRLAVQLPSAPGAWSRLMGLLEAADVEIHSVLSYPEAETEPHVILRVNTINVQGLVRTLCSEGYRVQWPTAKEWCR